MKLYDEDGIDGPFDKAMKKAMKSDKKRRTIRIGDFVTDEMFESIRLIGPDVKRIAAEVIGPNLEKINKKLGQQNDATYLAYAVVYAIKRSK